MHPVDPAADLSPPDLSLSHDLSDARRLEVAAREILRRQGRRRGRYVWNEQRDRILNA